MTELRTGLMLLSIACLMAGCSSSGSDDDPSGFDALEAEADSLVNEVQDLSFTDPATLPTTGAATYEGVMALDFASIPNETLRESDMAGDLELTVNFAAAGDPITGSATNFVAVDDETLEGTLIIGNGAIDRTLDPATGQIFSADMGGVLTAEDGSAWTVESVLGGDFVGEDHSHVVGVVAGSGCTAADCTGLGGAFVAER